MNSALGVSAHHIQFPGAPNLSDVACANSVCFTHRPIISYIPMQQDPAIATFDAKWIILTQVAVLVIMLTSDRINVSNFRLLSYANFA